MGSHLVRGILAATVLLTLTTDAAARAGRRSTASGMTQQQPVGSPTVTTPRVQSGTTQQQSVGSTVIIMPRVHSGSAARASAPATAPTQSTATSCTPALPCVTSGGHRFVTDPASGVSRFLPN